MSVTSSVTGLFFSASDRAMLVRCIPGVVLINTAGKGHCGCESLVLGVDMEEEKLSMLLPQIEKEQHWNFSFVDIADKDTFSYFAGWTLIPCVDESGMFPLIVSLRTQEQGWKAKDAELRMRKQLLDFIYEFNIAKIVHGEGETILLVGHVLECVAYSECISEQFTIERHHTWPPNPAKHPGLDPPPRQERHFWVKVKCPELSTLSKVRKDFLVHRQLARMGSILQLELQPFGAGDNYLVVYSDMDDAKKPDLGQQLCMKELWPDSLPDNYIPTSRRLV